ncbi:hypothetical protein APHAL10511_005359 [Amanita phalloides]|nr:hypothetical protein APHAL10511_005359 [Amanita phalloides]
MVLQKLKQKLGKAVDPLFGSHLTSSRPSATELSAVDLALPEMSVEQEVYQYRKQRGVNLGSWFVQERWICESTFRYAQLPGQSDLDIARGRNAKEVLEEHWDRWVQEDDWRWLREHGFNSVRIPIGYYHLCGVDPSVIVDTDFQSYGQVYAGAWSRITQAIETAHRHGIGVLIDLHAAPGKQNPDAHAGTSEPAKFFAERRHRTHCTRILCSLVANLSKFAISHSPPLPNIVGVELLNEPRPSSDDELMKWYTTTIKELRHIDGSIPIYVGDCWRLDQYANYINSLFASHRVTGLLALDHHLYRCFTDSDTHASASEHALALRERTPGGFSNAAEKLGRAYGGLVVGEWSAALNPRSLRGEENEVKNYVLAQLDLYEKTCAGWWFWTYKKEKRPDRGWCLLDAVNAGVFPRKIGMTATKWVSGDEARRENVREKTGKQAYDNHCGHWSQYPGQYEHERFAVGYLEGWNDAYQFLGSGVGSGSVSEVGFVAARANRRGVSESRSYWEYEHGFLQGVGAARRDFEEQYC